MGAKISPSLTVRTGAPLGGRASRTPVTPEACTSGATGGASRPVSPTVETGGPSVTPNAPNARLGLVSDP